MAVRPLLYEPRYPKKAIYGYRLLHESSWLDLQKVLYRLPGRSESSRLDYTRLPQLTP